MTHALLVHSRPQSAPKQRLASRSSQPVSMAAALQAPLPAAPAPLSATRLLRRKDLIARIRSQISLGRYDTDARLSIAVSRMIERALH